MKKEILIVIILVGLALIPLSSAVNRWYDCGETWRGEEKQVYCLSKGEDRDISEIPNRLASLENSDFSGMTGTLVQWTDYTGSSSKKHSYLSLATRENKEYFDLEIGHFKMWNLPQYVYVEYEELYNQDNSPSNENIEIGGYIYLEGEELKKINIQINEQKLNNVLIPGELSIEDGEGNLNSKTYRTFPSKFYLDLDRKGKSLLFKGTSLYYFPEMNITTFPKYKNTEQGYTVSYNHIGPKKQNAQELAQELSSERLGLEEGYAFSTSLFNDWLKTLRKDGQFVSDFWKPTITAKKILESPEVYSTYENLPVLINDATVIMDVFGGATILLEPQKEITFFSKNGLVKLKNIGTKEEDVVYLNNWVSLKKAEQSKKKKDYLYYALYSIYPLDKIEEVLPREDIGIDAWSTIKNPNSIEIGGEGTFFNLVGNMGDGGVQVSLNSQIGVSEPITFREECAQIKVLPGAEANLYAISPGKFLLTGKGTATITKKWEELDPPYIYLTSYEIIVDNELPIKEIFKKMDWLNIFGEDSQEGFRIELDCPYDEDIVASQKNRLVSLLNGLQKKQNPTEEDLAKLDMIYELLEKPTLQDVTITAKSLVYSKDAKEEDMEDGLNPKDSKEIKFKQTCEGLDEDLGKIVTLIFGRTNIDTYPYVVEE